MSSNQGEICINKQIWWILFSCPFSSQLQTCLGVIDSFCCNFIRSASQKLAWGPCYSKSIQRDDLFIAEGKSHRECWRKTRSQRFERAWWELGNTAAAGTGSPPSSLQDHCDGGGRARRAKRVTSGSTEVVGRAGGAEQLGKLNTLRGFFLSFCALMKGRVQMQNSFSGHILRLTSGWAEQLLALRQKQAWCCHWEFLVFHILHLKVCCQRILLKLWVLFTWVTFFFLLFVAEKHLRGVLR